MESVVFCEPSPSNDNPARPAPSSTRANALGPNTASPAHHARSIYRSGRRVFSWFVLPLFVIGLATGIRADGGGHGQQCNCNPGMGDAEVIQWDLPVLTDTSSGAITVDVHSSHQGRLWFLSRVGDVKLYRFQPGAPIGTRNATWKNFELNVAGITTGGLKRIKIHKNDRHVFVRTVTSLQRIDTGDCKTVLLTETCKRITWLDQLTNPNITVSDVATDDCNVYTTTFVLDGTIDKSYLQQLSPCRNAIDPYGNGTTGTTQVKRWVVGGGAGFCEAAVDSAPCLSGVATHPWKDYLVYFSQPGNNKIGELDVRNNNVRRWDLSKLGADVFEPRQLDVDDDGTVWAVTGSGHLVRLDPYRNRMSKHLMPSGAAADPFGVAPDHGVIGYTNSAQDVNKVAMLIPKGNTIYVAPAPDCIQPQPVTVNFMVEDSVTSTGYSPPMRRIVHAQITDKGDGLFVEGLVAEAQSNVPLGITPDFGHKMGTFFYAVGVNFETGFNRIGKIVLPFKNRKFDHGRDEDDHDHDGKRDDLDDDDDDDGIKDVSDNDDDNDCVNDDVDDDDDDDGIKDRDDHPGKREERRSYNEQYAAQSATDYDVNLDSTTLLLAATVTSVNPTSLVSIEVYGPSGALLASPIPTPGVAAISVPTLQAGAYKVRIKNVGLSASDAVTDIITEGNWPANFFDDLLP
jgi:streptogramin lyase